MTPTQNSTPEEDDTDIVDEEDFILMTPAVTLSQQIASQTQVSPVSFQKSMMNMLGDRLRKVPKDYQFRSSFESKGRRPIVPLTKALALMKEIEQDHRLQMYVCKTLHRTSFIVFNCNILHPHYNII
jgi:hypothetical protein